MIFVTWANDSATWIRDSIEFFEGKNKFEREKWVVKELLSSLKIKFYDSELTPADEPIDVSYKENKFQVKEIFDPERRRKDEFEDKYQKINRLMSNDDYLGITDTYTNPTAICFCKVVSECRNLAIGLQENKYGALGAAKIDLLFYFNKRDLYATPSQIPELQGIQFRSLSVVTNTYCSVVFAKSTCPEIFRDKVGKLMIKSAGG